MRRSTSCWPRRRRHAGGRPTPVAAGRGSPGEVALRGRPLRATRRAERRGAARRRPRRSRRARRSPSSARPAPASPRSSSWSPASTTRPPGGCSSTASTVARPRPRRVPRQLGFVPQEAFLFSGTIRDNIAYGRPDATDAEVEAAARAVGAHDFIARLPGGYLHRVSERGRSLSAGQRQLIALARAHLVDPAILLLDEATVEPRPRHRGPGQRAMRWSSPGPHHAPHRPPAADRRGRRPHRRDRRRPHRRARTDDELLAHGGSYASMWEVLAA